MPKLIMFNQQVKGLIKEVNHTDGIRYLVAPTVAIIEGVMNETLYLGDEIQAFIEAWDGRPLIIDHPQDTEGDFVSANSPELLRETLGFYFNAKYTDNKLKGEWWVDIAKAEKSIIGKQVLKSLREGLILEQSTGLFTDIEEKSGEFNGVHYENIARNIRPDHVAILLHEEGACSIKDGCGTPRVNTQDNNDTITFELKTIKETLKKYGQTLTDFVVNFRGNNNDLEENQMSREELIDWILQNNPVPMTREMLELATDEELAQIGESIAPPTEPSTLEEGEAVEINEGDNAIIFTPTATNPISGVSPDPATPSSDAGGGNSLLPKEVIDFMNTLKDFGGNAGIKKLIEDIQAKHAAEYDGLLSMLVANSNYSEDELKNLPVDFLRKMAANIQTEEVQTPIYGNRSLGINTAQPQSDWEVYGANEEGGKQ